MEQCQPKIYQVIAKLLDGKSRSLNFETPVIPISFIKEQIQNITSIPVHQQLLLSNGKTLFDDGVLYHGNSSPSTVHLLLRLRGGKGGFGSLLRGAATKAGQKKTNNFDACRDMSGRRLRHVNAEKKMDEWLAEEKERKLEKAAEEFIKKKAKAVKKGGGGDGSEKYVEKYRKDSAKCMEEVDKSVRESLAGGFRKSKRTVAGVDVEDGWKSKKLKIWMGKRKVDDSESDEEDSDEENEKSVVTNNENGSDSNKKEADGSLASVTGGKVEGESSVGCSSEEDKETELGSVKDSKDERVDAEEDIIVKNSKAESVDLEERKSEVSNVEKVEICDSKLGISEQVVSPDLKKPLDFDEFNSAVEMEVVGLERLKSELQERGLKCGGTLQERAARLFLLKTTPIEMLPKKLLAKK